MRRGLLTQYQLERLIRSESRTGFFYGDYKVLYCVGAGTFARVFRAIHRDTGKMYAVKVLRSSLSNPKGTHPKTGKSLKLYIDLFRREVRWPDGSRSDLSETEAALLKYLVCNRERAVSREELLSRVWGIGTAGLETRAVDMHVARLRAKLRSPDGGDDEPEAIVTVRAHGYMAGPALSVPSPNGKDGK